MRKLHHEWLMAAVYIFFSFLSFYCCCYRVPVGVKYVVNLVIVAWALAAFLIRPQFEHMIFCARFLLMFFMPFLIFWLWSLVLWTLDFQTTDYIIRGSQNIIYMLTNFAYVAAAFYLFGKRAVYYTFFAMLAANGVVLLEIGLANGFGELLSEYVVLVTSFANVTGPVIRQMEIHDIVFAFPPFILYFLIHKEKKVWINIVCIALATFFFSLAFKRIAAIAVVAALLVAVVYRLLSEKGKKNLITITAVSVIVFAFGYIAMIKTGAFFTIAERFGINLMGRDSIFSSYNDFFTLSPTFLGNGIRFIYNHGVTTGGIAAIHNVYLELYIELGFVVWLFWLWYDISYRSKWIGNHFSYRAATCLVAMTVYALITYMTDNTYFQFAINVCYRLLAMTWCYEVATEDQAHPKELAPSWSMEEELMLGKE